MQMMTLSQVLSDYVPGDAGCYVSEDQMWLYKMAEAVGSAMLESVEKDGIQEPISIRNGRICNGHHRLALAILLCMDEVPVQMNVHDCNAWQNCEHLPISEIVDQEAIGIFA